MIKSDWKRCYGQGWGDLLTPEAYSHPAKVSRALARRIYDHLIDEGWLEPGMVVLDPFAGIGGFALHAMKHGLCWVGVELEEKFVDLGQQNIDLWNSRFSKLPGWGSAVILQGDSRKLAEVVGGAGGCVSSPPYVGSLVGADDLEKRSKRVLAVYPDHPRYGQKGYASGKQLGTSGQGHGYGTDPANLGNMPAGSLDAVVSIDKNSLPCYNNGSLTGGFDNDKERLAIDGRVVQTVSSRPVNATDSREFGCGLAVYTGKVQKGRVENEKSIGGSQAGSSDGKTQGCGGKGTRPLGLERRQGTPELPREGQKGKVRGLRGKVEPLRSPQELRPLRQQPRELTDSLCGLSHQPTQASVLGRSEGRQRATKVEWPNRMEEVTDGQLATLPEGELDAVVSSPPWMAQVAGNQQREQMRNKELADDRGDTWAEYGDESPKESTIGGDRTSDEAKAARKDRAEDVANLGRIVVVGNQGNLVNTDTFWSASRQIVQQVYQVLAPGAPAVWVVKSFVRSGKRVDFPNQWRQLCESVGFETVHLHRAWLVEDRGSQFDLFGNVQENKVERKSFFRRLHEQNASAKMYWEQHVTDRDTKAGYIWRAKAVLWAKRRYDLAEDKEDVAPVTRSRIITAARSLAYVNAGKPWMDIDTRIDWEVVLCQRKPM